MGKRKAKEAQLRDLYEAEELEPEEETKTGQRYDRVDNFQYELPADFEDEEIDEELAFTEEDKISFAHKLGSSQRRDNTQDTEAVSEEPNELTRDDFSDDDSEADRLYGKAQEGGSVSEDDDSGDSEVDSIFAGVNDDNVSGMEEGDELPMSEAELAKATKIVEEALGSGKQKRKKQLRLLDEAVPESEYNISLGKDGVGELSLEDLMGALGSKKGRKLTIAQKQLNKLARESKPVAPPLPGPIRARKERQVGYEETKKDVAKWTPLVRVNREAPTLVFTAPKNDIPQAATTAALTANFKPQGRMEAKVAEMLKAAGAHSDQAVQEAEEALALKAISAEEMAERREQLAKMRSLMFKHEQKSKHLAKIKSKDYHRRAKRSARRTAEKSGEMEDEDFIRLEAEKAEYQRAKERLTLKHKNTSKWARRALKRGLDHQDDGKKEAIAEQLRLGEELRRRIDRVDPVEGSDTDASNENSNSGTSSESEVEGKSSDSGRKLGRKASAKARAAAAAILEGDGEDNISKGLFALPFMKRAQERRKMAAEAEARQLLAELDNPLHAEELAPPGRRNFGLQGGVQASTADFGDVSEEDGDSEADIEEDVEAKAQRLRQARESERGLSGQAETTANARGLSASKLRHRVAGNSGKTRSRGLGGGQAVEDTSVIHEEVELPGSRAVVSHPPAVVDDSAGRLTRLEEAYQTQPAAKAGRSQEPAATALQRVTAEQRELQTRLRVLPSQTVGKPVKDGAEVGQQKGGMAVSVGPRSSSAGTPAANGEVLQEPSVPAFLPAKMFDGEKPGYTFGKGASGRLGYHLDPLQQLRTKNGEDRQPVQPQSRREEPSKSSDEQSDEENEDGMHLAGGEEAQRALIARAFAGDDVVAEFEADKDKEVDSEVPKVETPSLLPGWGTWAGSQREPAWMTEARAEAERKRRAAKLARKDANLSGVSISERWDKKAAKFCANTLPYPFNSKEAFEGSMRQPLGPDYNTHTSFREMTKPSIIKHSGVIIQPLKFSQALAEEKRAISRTENYNRPAVARIAGGKAHAVKQKKGNKAVK